MLGMLWFVSCDPSLNELVLVDWFHNNRWLTEVGFSESTAPRIREQISPERSVSVVLFVESCVRKFNMILFHHQ